MDSTGCGGKDEASTLVALISYENRIDAERVSKNMRTIKTNDTALWQQEIVMCNFALPHSHTQAKSEISNLNGSLTCTWHNPSASAGSAAKSDGQSPYGKDHALGTDGYDDDHGLMMITTMGRTTENNFLIMKTQTATMTERRILSTMIEATPYKMMVQEMHHKVHLVRMCCISLDRASYVIITVHFVEGFTLS